ncbi:MAG: hypothetical protein K9N07_01715 [Candidatus Cloacimonetes bacterium]|nr:hypothetical protein [Candidatus Cloacimonadota bacterium]
MKKILVIVIFTIALNLSAQYDLGLTVTPSQRTYNILYPANFNPDEPEMQPILFNISIIGQPPDNAVLYCRMQWENEEAEITLTPNTPGMWPAQLNSSLVINSNPPGFEVVQTFNDFLDGIDDILITSGRMPDGIYIFHIGIYESGHEGEEDYLLSNPETALIIIRSPISISLITPGNPIGLGVSVISSQNPNFIWFSNLNDYQLRLFEVEEMGGSAEEIEMQDPIFTEPNIQTTNFSYPASAPTLQFDKTYAWQISATVTSPNISSQTVYKSTLYLFKLSNTESDAISYQILINFINQLDIDGVDEAISLLETGYRLDNIIWNGYEIPVEKLIEILEEISSGVITPVSITIE